MWWFVMGLVVGLVVGFYVGVAYGAPAWLDFAAEQAKQRKQGRDQP